MAYIYYPAVLTAHRKGEQSHDPSSPSLYDLTLYAESRNFAAVNAWPGYTAATNDSHAAAADASANNAFAGAAAAATLTATTTSAPWGGTNH